ncbi:hypothetical protein QEN19_003757 [Hanseniaspora menglaensis]
METQIKYIKFYNRFRGQGQTLLNSGYFDLDYCDVVNKLAYIISENIKSGTINAKVNYYNLFLDQKYKFINGEIIDQDIELMIGKNYKYLHAILDELIEICLWNPECEDELLTLNILMFSRNENNIVNPLINLYFESSKQHVNLINKIIATKRQSFQGFVFLKNFAKINGKNALNKSILKNKAINFLTYFITTADISKTSLYILLEIITYQDYTLSSKTLKSFKEKIDNLLLDFKLTKFESKFLLLLKATLSKNTTYTLKTELETKYKEPHYTLWSAKWTDLIYEKLNDEHQDINFIKWVIDNTDIPITESFLKIQYEKSLPQHKLLWEMFLGKFNSKIDQYIFEKCGLVSQLESLDYKENYEDSLITLNRVLQKRFLFYDVGVLFESEFYKVNYIFTNESLKFVIGNIASLKSADVSIERLKKIGDLEFEFSKSIDICLKPLIVDIKLRTNDHRFFCKRIELQVFLNKMFIETKDMNQAQFEKFFALCEFKKVTRNIHTDHDSFIIFLSKLKRYNLKMININNDLMYLYSMCGLQKKENGKQTP